MARRHSTRITSTMASPVFRKIRITCPLTKSSLRSSNSRNKRRRSSSRNLTLSACLASCTPARNENFGLITTSAISPPGATFGSRSAALSSINSASGFSITSSSASTRQMRFALISPVLASISTRNSASRNFSLLLRRDCASALPKMSSTVGKGISFSRAMDCMYVSNSLPASVIGFPCFV